MDRPPAVKTRLLVNEHKPCKSLDNSMKEQKKWLPKLWFQIYYEPPILSNEYMDMFEQNLEWSATNLE